MGVAGARDHVRHTGLAGEAPLAPGPGRALGTGLALVALGAGRTRLALGAGVALRAGRALERVHGGLAQVTGQDRAVPDLRGADAGGGDVVRLDGLVLDLRTGDHGAGDRAHRAEADEDEGADGDGGDTVLTDVHTVGDPQEVVVKHD